MMQLLAKKYSDLDNELKEKKRELEAKLIPLFEEFLNETGLMVDSARPTFVDATAMEDEFVRYAITGAMVTVSIPRTK